MTALPTITYRPGERVDLHVHSHYSDGVHPPAELAEMAGRHSLSVIALTDHASVNGIAALTVEAARHGVYVIPGVELNSPAEDFLGYFIDCQNKDLVEFLRAANELRQVRIREILVRLASLGHDIEYRDLVRFAQPAPPSRTHIARMLVRRNVVSDTDEAFARFLGRKAAGYVPPRAHSANECVRIIQEAGGIAVQTHPHFLYDAETADLDASYSDLAAMGVVGIDLQPTRDPRLAQFQNSITHAAERHGLIRVQSSDFHGAQVTDARLGEPCIGGDVLEELMARLPGESPSRSLFKRMKWRQENLTADEFAASLRPQRIVLQSFALRELLDLPHDPSPQSPPAGCPFVLIGPGALQATENVERVLREHGVATITTIDSSIYPELAWTLYDLAAEPGPKQLRYLLRFNLDRHLFGESAMRCRIVFIAVPDDVDLRVLKKHIRHALGRIQFYEVTYNDIQDTCLTSFIHMPDKHKIPIECWRLRQRGICVTDN